jgi:hypothetical protein
VKNKKMQSKIQARLDNQLARAVAIEVAAAKNANPEVGTCAVVRMLLREALAARGGRVLPVSDQGFIEGFMRGSSEAQRAVQTALHSRGPSGRPQ